jgi:hypothetical protein
MGLLVAGGLVLGLACCDGMEMVGDAMVEAGTMLSGAGDAMAPDAAAQATVLEADCGVGWSLRTETATAVTVTEHLYADVRDGAIDPATVSHAEAFACGWHYFGPSPGPATCPDGATCTESGSTVQLDCIDANVQLEPGHARVFCGSHTQVIVAGETTESGSSRQRVRFVLR